MHLNSVLKNKFGYDSFRMGQREIIEDILAGNDVVALLPTGGGKSICYQLPGYVGEGSVLIISPLLSLMEDQVEQLRLLGEKKVIALNSFLSLQEKRHAINELQDYRFIFISPEMLQTNYVIDVLKKVKISLFVIDEAHCISQWGHDFRTDYLKLRQIRELVGNPPCLSLTATATNEVLQDIVKSLGLKSFKKHTYSVDRPNIAISVEKVNTVDDKMDRVVRLVTTLQGPGIIYFSSRYWTEIMCKHLQKSGIENVAYYHGGLDQEQRMLIQQQFLNNQLELICCTSAFGMGVNKRNIRYVLHFHFPNQLEAYLQEIGRAGRDGQESVANIIYCSSDHDVPKLLIESELPTAEQVQHTLYYLTSAKRNKYGLKLSKEFEEQLFQKVKISEVHWRFIKFQLEENMVINNEMVRQSFDIDLVAKQITEVVNIRLEQKQKKLSAMINWIHSTTCRRKGILTYFGETSFTKQKLCCDRCGLRFEPYQRRHGVQQKLEFVNWKKELDEILLISE